MSALAHKWLVFLVLPFFASLPKKKEVSLSVVPHPFYVSVTEATHNAATKSVEISCKFFSEDIEQTLEKAYKTNLDVTAAKDKAAFDKLLPDYINKHLSFVIDGRPVSLTYVGFEKEKESVYTYFEIAGIGAVKNISISNSLLHDFIDQQINIMHITVGGKRQSTKLDYPDTKAAFAF